MERMVQKMLRCFGREMRLCRGQQEQVVYGFFQSVTGKNERLARLHPGPLGLENPGQYIYLGPVEPRAEQGDLLKVGDRVYTVQTAQVVFGTAKPAYVWAMCVEKGGEDGWGRNG